MAETKEMKNMTPDEIEEQIKQAEQQAATTGEPKAKKPKKPRIIKVTAVVPEGAKPGDEFTFDYELPVGARRGGVNAGIPVEEMDEAQLRIERRNAHSVWYKANKKDPKSEGTARAKARLDKVEAIMKDKGISVSVRKPLNVADIAAAIKGGTISLEELNAMLKG